jgi:hypothetical protein
MCTSIPDRYRLLLYSRRTAQGAPRPAGQLKRWAIAAASIAALLGPLMAPNADAGTYVIDNCPSAPGANGNPGPWTVFGAPQNYKGSCTGGPGNWIGPLGGSMSPGQLDGVQVVAPAGSGITIREALIWWFVPQQSSGATTFALASVNTGAVEEADTPKDSSITPDDLVLPSTTTELTLADYCSNDDAGAGCTFGSGENPDLELLGAQLTLADSNLPSGTVTGGALAGTGTLAGTGALTYTAQDADSGVRLVQLLLDGQPVAEHDYLAECPYQDFAACPTSVSGEIQWNTTEASDGTHELALRVIDAAGNALIVGEHPVTIDNPPAQTSSGSISGASGGPAAHVANGDPCAGEELGLRVNGERGVPVIPYGKPVTVQGVLHCGTVAIRDAQVAIATVAGPASAASDSTVQTGLDGSFSYTVPAGPDRSLQFSYTAYSDDPGPSASAIATIAIRPKIKLKIGPQHTSNRHSIRWAGTIAGGPIPAQGVTLDVEVQEGRRWRIFDQIVTSHSGKFRYSYRFHATVEATTYKFRVALPDNGSVGYPYTPGASNTVAVHVMP